MGSSRGACAARSLSGLISKCGVLTPGAPLSIEQLYARYRRASEPTIRDLAASPEKVRSLEERWLLAHCVVTNIKFVGVYDTVGSLGNPLGPMHRKVEQYRFLDTHLRLSNEAALQALALDEQRKPFEPTSWTRSTDNADSASGAKPRPLDQVEQRWFVGAHANVGGGYPSDILAQAPLKWLMDKATSKGLAFRPGFSMDPPDPMAPVRDSYAEFGNPLLRAFSKRFDRPVGPNPQVGSVRTTERINETIDGSDFDRWRGNSGYRPANLKAWAEIHRVDPSALTGARLASNPSVQVP